MLPPEGVKCYCKDLEMGAGSGLDSRDRIPSTEFQNWEVILYVAGGGAAKMTFQGNTLLDGVEEKEQKEEKQTPRKDGVTETMT